MRTSGYLSVLGALAAVGVLAGAARGQTVNAVANGSFEDPLGGEWTVQTTGTGSVTRPMNGDAVVDGPPVSAIDGAFVGSVRAGGAGSTASLTQTFVALEDVTTFYYRAMGTSAGAIGAIDPPVIRVRNKDGVVISLLSLYTSQWNTSPSSYDSGWSQENNIGIANARGENVTIEVEVPENSGGDIQVLIDAVSNEGLPIGFVPLASRAQINEVMSVPAFGACCLGTECVSSFGEASCINDVGGVYQGDATDCVGPVTICGGDPPPFVPNTVEEFRYIEILTPEGQADLTGLTFLEIDNDGADSGQVDVVIDFAGEITGTNGLLLGSAGTLILLPFRELETEEMFLSAPQLAFEGGARTFLLVHGFTGSQGDDLDADNDGRLDAFPWDYIADFVEVRTDGDPATSTSFAAQLGRPVPAACERDSDGSPFQPKAMVRVGACDAALIDYLFSPAQGPYTIDDDADNGFEFAAGVTLSPGGANDLTPVSGTCVGDLDGDGDTDVFDFATFAVDFGCGTLP